MNTDKKIGVIAALLISITAGIALPLIKILNTLETSELMVIRGAVTAALVGLLFGRRIRTPSRHILTFSGVFSLATLTLYEGIRAWGLGPTLTVLAMTPVVNITAKIMRAERVAPRVYFALALLIVGVALAVNPWQMTFDRQGFLFSVMATLFSGIGFEVLAGKKDIDQYDKVFWLAVITALVGVIVTIAGGQVPFAQEVWSFTYVGILISFGVVGGFAYYMSIVVAFKKLPAEVASVIAMAETPFCVLVGWSVLAEPLTAMQWEGVLLAFMATMHLANSESREE